MEHLRTFDIQLVLKSIYNGIIAIDEEGIINYFNKTAERMFNLPAHEAINRYILDVLQSTGGNLLECLKTGTPFYGKKIKGEKVTFISNISPIVSNGKISGVVSVFQDISEIEETLKELDLFKNMKNWLDTIIDYSYDGLWICDHDGKVVRVNKASERINNLKAEDVTGKYMTELVAEGLFDQSVTLDVLEKKTSVSMIQQLKGGKRIMVTGNPILNEKGEVAFVVTNDRDISELDLLRSQLNEAQALAKGYISKLSDLEMRGVNLSHVIFRSEKTGKIIEAALRVAQVDSTVFLLGNSGVGKGMIAKLIHKQSERSKGPFVRVNCAAIPDSLIESELFGYETGAFTGARNKGKPGFFELANGGTLFLDEVGEIPLGSQSKLLHFLEDHEITRVGGTESKGIDVRIIAATNRNIEELVASKKFREDLFYRLNIIPITVPPLSDRREDILPLAFYFLERFNKTYGKKKTFSPEILETLYRYDFPGNTRELANLVERLIVMSENEKIANEDLASSITGHLGETILLDYAKGTSLKEAVDRYERKIIEMTIQKFGSQREAAKILKVDQGTISRKIKKYSNFKGNVVSHI